ncbi:MAG TPA: sigma factor [Alphaproteobacteria bacterium]|nr:sigma factor [Alphaproteobacteria bacterium]
MTPFAEALADTELVALVKGGQGAMFAEIMRRNNRRLFRLVRAVVGDDAEAEEIVQETYVRAYTALARWREDASLAAWLSRIAINEALGTPSPPAACRRICNDRREPGRRCTRTLRSPPPSNEHGE